MNSNSKIISEDELLSLYLNSKILIHLAKTPLDTSIQPSGSNPQLYALGFNIGGRPDGLWVSHGSDWLIKAKEINNPQFPICCYIYNIILSPDARILYVNRDNFAKFDSELPSYWLNLDYFDVDFVDYLSNKKVKNMKKKQLVFNKLTRRQGDSLRDVLIQNHIIFNTSSDAIRGCSFYKQMDEEGLAVERFKYKDWAAIAQKYHGVIFEFWDLNDVDSMKYLWFQSLDIASGCIWDASAIVENKMLYYKISADSWRPYSNH